MICWEKSFYVLFTTGLLKKVPNSSPISVIEKPFTPFMIFLKQYTKLSVIYIGSCCLFSHPARAKVFEVKLCTLLFPLAVQRSSALVRDRRPLATTADTGEQQVFDNVFF